MRGPGVVAAGAALVCRAAYFILGLLPPPYFDRTRRHGWHAPYLPQVVAAPALRPAQHLVPLRAPPLAVGAVSPPAGRAGVGQRGAGRSLDRTPGPLRGCG